MATANGAYTTLANAPGTGGSSFVAQTGEGARFAPLTPPYQVTFWPDGEVPHAGNMEVGTCTARATDTFTVTRATENPSVARNAQIGWRFAAAVTADMLNEPIVYGPSPYIDIRSRGAKVDGVRVTGVSTTNTSTTLTAPAGTFNTATDVGKYFTLNAGGTPRNTNADGAITSGSQIFTATLASAFTSMDIGKAITIPGAGAGGSLLHAEIEYMYTSGRVRLNVAAGTSVSGATATIYNALWGTLTAVASDTSATMSLAASSTYANAVMYFGTNDAVAIQAAWDDAEDFACEVYHPRGISFTAAQLVPRPGITVRGDGIDSTIIKVRGGLNNHILRSTSAARFKLRDLTIDGSIPTFSGTPGAGIFISSSSDIVIQRVKVWRTADIAFAFNACPRVAISYCMAQENGREGYWFAEIGAVGCEDGKISHSWSLRTGRDGLAVHCNNFTIYDNDCESSPIPYGLIYSSDNRYRNRIIGNRCSDSGTSGIDLGFGTTDASYGNTVVGNICNSNVDNGISTGLNGTVISGNICLNNGQPGGSKPYGILIDAANCVVTGNRCTDTQGVKTQTYGLAMLNNSGATTKMTALGNDLEGNVNAGIFNFLVVGGSHIVFGNRGVEDSTPGNFGIGGLDPTYPLHIFQSGDNAIHLARSGVSQNFDIFVDSGRSLRFSKSSGGAVGSSLNTRFYFGDVGGLDAITPFWSGFQWQGHSVTQGGAAQFPTMTLFSRSAVAADPTDYEFMFSAANAADRPVTIGFGSNNKNTSSVRFGFGNAGISAEAFRAYYDGTNSFVGIGVTAPAHKLQINTGTVTTNIRAVDVTTTWNEANTVFEAMRISVGDTASDATAKVANFLVGGSSVASIEKDGTVASVTALRTKHEGTNTPTAGASGDIRVGSLRIWLNDAGTWRTFTQDGLYSAVAPVTIAGTLTETSLGTFTIPANFLRAGTSLRLTAGGVMGTHSTGTPAPTWRVRIGGVGSVLSGNIVSTIAVTSAASQTNKGWQADFILTCRTAGAAGTIIGNGVCANEVSATAPNDNKLSAVTATVAVDTTQQRDIAMTFQWGANNANNTLTAHNVSYDVAVA